MTVVNLSKGEKVNLSKATVNLAKEKGGSSTLDKVFVGIGWASASQTSGGEKSGILSRIFGGGGGGSPKHEIDCDAFAVVLNTMLRACEREDLVWYGNLSSGEVVKHAGDNLVGGSDGDDERIHISLDKVETGKNEVLVGVNIYQGKDRGQHFGMLKDAYIRVVDEVRGVELARYKLDNTNDGLTTLFFGRFVKEDGEWSFEALGDPGQDGGIPKVVRDYLSKR